MTAPHFLDAFEAVVAAHGARTAVEDERGALSYADLWERAGAVASRLEPGSVVAVRLPRTREAIVALLGIWRAKAIYVPLDPMWPEERTSFVLQDAGAVTTIDAAWDFDAGAAATAARDVNDAAYVIYTSGSTGSPKGVVVSHRGLVPVLRAQIDALGINLESRCLLVLSTAFDASLSDIGTSLLAGATLVLEPADLLRSPRDLVATLERQRITHVDLPPALLPRIDPSTLPPALEQIVVGGESSPPATLRAWARHVRVLVAYGPTEATICTSMMQVDPETWSRPLIGRALPGVTYAVHALGERGIGELLIGGAHLAHGYRGRSELDEERFFLEDGQRWYRTGDRVWMRSEEDIEFLGRVDRQLKVAGVLVAPEEIEACLRARVARAAVVWRELRSGVSGLVAFVERGEDGVSPDALRSHVLAALPRALCPRWFEVLDALPETSSGKVDLDALVRRPLAARTFEPPRSETELVLAACFAEVLAAPEVSRDDDFFALGGDSFSVLELAAAAQGRGLWVPPHAVYLQPVLRLLAEVLAHPEREELPAAELRAEVHASLARVLEARPGSLAPDLSRTGAVFFTGATGFLGARVLGALIERGERDIHCLVRASSAEEARRRLASRIDPDKLARVRVVCGDVAAPRFGLAAAEWQHLSDVTSEVFHLAAAVDMVRPFEALRAANLDGTAEVLRFVRAGRVPKRMQYASTLSVLVATEAVAANEEDDLSDTRVVFGGYAQTKWAAEVAVRAAAPSATIHRLGLLTSALAPFAAPAGCQLTMFLRGVLTLGCLPEGDLDELALDVTPVDYAARAFVALASRAGTVHVANPRSLTLGVILAAFAERGVRVERVGPAELARRAAAPLSPEAATVLLSLARRLDPRALASRSTDLFLATSPTWTARGGTSGARDFGTSRTVRELEAAGIVCPTPQRVLEAHLDHLLAERSP